MPFRFLKFPVYKLAREFYSDIVKVTQGFPRDELYVLVSQLKRAALSIVLNIAEGSDRGSDKDFNRFLVNSLGSLNEVVAGLDLALRNDYIKQALFDELTQKASQLSNQLAGFSKKLKNS